MGNGSLSGEIIRFDDNGRFSFRFTSSSSPVALVFRLGGFFFGAPSLAPCSRIGLVSFSLSLTLERILFPFLAVFFLSFLVSCENFWLRGGWDDDEERKRESEVVNRRESYDPSVF
jgi:hypothetical protein